LKELLEYIDVVIKSAKVTKNDAMVQVLRNIKRLVLKDVRCKNKDIIEMVQNEAERLLNISDGQVYRNGVEDLSGALLGSLRKGDA
jgi:hypothetical protein